jgi:hypothetical protein
MSSLLDELCWERNVVKNEEKENELPVRFLNVDELWTVILEE